MKIGIRFKLAIVVAAIAVTIALLIFLSMLLSFRSGFLQYVNNVRLDHLQLLQISIEETVTSESDWQRLTKDKRFWNMLLRKTFRENMAREHSDRYAPEQRPLPNQRPPRPGAFYLLDNDKRIIFGKPIDFKRPLLLPLNIHGERMGYVGIHKAKGFYQQADKAFVAKQTTTFLAIAIMAALIGALTAFFLAHWMVAPIKRLNNAMKNLISHDYTIRVRNNSADEIGELMQSFNRLAITLAEHEQSQQRWIADISHELRTPLATLRGEIEALQDGVRTLTPQRIDSLHEEIVHIQRIVDDLHQLALSDLGALRYAFDETDVKSIIEKVQSHNENALNQNQLSFHLTTKNTTAMIQGDDARLHQLFSNLMQNSLRYTHRGGEICVELTHIDNHLVIHWQDSAPGVDKSSHAKLFDRLFREETSRNRSQGGSGLGLSIVKAITEAHQGEITSEDSPLGGLKITLTLPLTLS